MKLIAESGSTKTDWRLIDDQNQIHQYRSFGLNPYMHDHNSVVEEVKTKIVPEVSSKDVDNIFFYGSGCSQEARCNLIKEALQECFPNASITVQHDLLAAARALFNREAGIAAILGTGSNAGYYDGEKITENRGSYGFILADEGSGSYMGKKLLKAYLNGDMPDDLMQSFEKRFGITTEAILESVYSKPFPNRYLASYSKYILQQIKHPFISKLVDESIRDFFDTHIDKFEQAGKAPLGFSGSVAFYFDSYVRRVAQEKGYEVRRIIENPVAGLTLFHGGG